MRSHVKEVLSSALELFSAMQLAPETWRRDLGGRCFGVRVGVGLGWVGSGRVGVGLLLRPYVNHRKNIG